MFRKSRGGQEDTIAGVLNQMLEEGRLIRRRKGKQNVLWSRATGEASRQATFLLQAIHEADRDTVERHGGLNVVVEKVLQWEQENPASNGREMIDDFRLRGARTWRRMGGHLTKGGWRT